MVKNRLRVGNELDALIISLLATSIFYGLLWALFYYGLGNPAHRIFILLGGTWPTGIIQFVTVLAFIWAMLVLGSKSRKINWETNALSLGLLPEEEHKVLLPKDINELRLSVSKLTEWQESIFVKTIVRACTKFRANKSPQETMDVVKIQAEMDLNYLDSSFNIIRYLAWSIPSIGFIGTVIGISGALERADEAVGGDISGVTSMLGTAFDTTLLALFLSIILMFQLHRTQQREESLILSVQDHIMENLVNRIYVPKEERI